MRGKCEGCPVAGPCVGQREGRAWACSMATHAAGVRYLHGASAAPPPPPPAAGLAEDMALLMQARSCRHKSTPSCGCRYGDCARLGREVYPRECIACLKAGDDARPPEVG